MEKQKEQLASLSQEIAKTRVDAVDLSRSNATLLIDALKAEQGNEVAELLSRVTANPQVDLNSKIGELLNGQASDEEIRAISDNLQQSKSLKEQEIGQRKLQVLREKIDRLALPEGFALRHLEAAEFNQDFSTLLAQELNIVDPNALAPLLGSEVGQEALKRKFGDYEKQHDQAMEKEFSRELKEKMSREPISPDMAIQHLEEDEFEQTYFDELLKNASPELLEELEEHANLRDKLFRNDSVSAGLKKKYSEYEKAHDSAMETKFSAELEELINAGELTDDFALIHREEDDFSSEYFELMLRDASPELLEELGEHRDLKDKLFATSKVKSALAEKFKNYEQEHERMMENTFSKELEELIGGTPIPDEMASRHLEDEEFQELFFARILEKASPELRQELEEHAELQETLFSHRKVSSALSKKTIDYEKAHEEAMKKKFTVEITEKVKARRISAKFAEKHRDEEEFQDDFFQEILAEASPELREELGEHEDLEETLFEQAEVEAVLEKKFLDYEKAHDASMEAVFSTELMTKVSTAKIPQQMLAQDFKKDEFSTAFFEVITKGASPELKEELVEHKDLRQKLFENKRVQVSLEKHFDHYEKFRKKEKKKHDLEEKKQAQKEEKEREKEKLKREKQEEKAKKVDIEALEREIPKRLELSEKDIAEEDYHREQGGFAAFTLAMEGRISDLLPEDTGLHEDFQIIADREVIKQYAAWKQGHEKLHSAEMKSARQGIEAALILTEEDYQEESFHEPKVLQNTLQGRLSVVFAAIPDDLHAGLQSYTREKIAATEAQWRRRHELLESQEMKDAKKQLRELFVLEDADKENETLHDPKRFEFALRSRLEPTLDQFPADLQKSLQPWLRAEIGKLHTVWSVTHEAHEKSLIEKAEKNITQKLELHPDDRDNELFHKERVFRTAMRGRIVGVLSELPTDLKQEVATIAEAKISDSYHQWREAHEREHEENLAMAKTKFDHIIESSDRKFRKEGDQIACSADITDRANAVIEALPEDLRAEAGENLAEKMSTFFKSWKKTETDTTEKKSPWEKSADFGRYSAKDLQRGHERLEALVTLTSMKTLLKQRERFFMPFLLMTTIMISESEFGNLKRSLQGKSLHPEETMRMIFDNPNRLRKTMLMKVQSPEVWKSFKQGLEKMKLPLDDLLNQKPTEDDQDAPIEEEAELEVSEENPDVPTDITHEFDQKNTLEEDDAEEDEADEEVLEKKNLEKNTQDDEETEENDDRENLNQDEESKQNPEKNLEIIPKTPGKATTHNIQRGLGKYGFEGVYRRVGFADTSRTPKSGMSDSSNTVSARPDCARKTISPVRDDKEWLDQKTPDIAKQLPSTEHPRALKDFQSSPGERIPDKKPEAPKVMTDTVQAEKTQIREQPKIVSETPKIIVHKEKTEERKPRMNQIEQQILIKNSKEKEAFVFYANVQRDEQMARYLESILLEKEKHSITLKSLLQAFIQYARLSSGLTIPFSIHISPEILNMTLLDAEKLFSDLAHHYHGCCAKHAKTSLFLFRCWPTWQDSATIQLKLAFDIEQPEINEVCAVFVECEVQKNVVFSHL